MEWFWYGDALFRSLFTYQNALWAVFVGIVLSSGYFLVFWGLGARRAYRRGMLEGIGWTAVADYVTLPGASLLIGLLAIFTASKYGIPDPSSFVVGLQRLGVWTLVLVANLLRTGRYVFRLDDDVTQQGDVIIKEKV